MAPSPFEQTLESVGLPQAELARLVGVSAAAVSRWCTGLRRPPAQAYAALADVLAPAQLLQLQREHEAWLATRQAARFAFITRLPEGMTRQHAEHAVADAFNRLADGETTSGSRSAP